MATIDFRQWRISSEPDCWVLGKPKTRLNKKKEREIYLEHPTYHASLQQALTAVVERELRGSDATTAAAVLEDLRGIRSEIKALLS